MKQVTKCTKKKSGWWT